MPGTKKALDTSVTGLKRSKSRVLTSPPGSIATSSAVNVDNNSCIEGSVIGGLLGAGLGAALSRKQGRWVGVPVGAAAGAMVGCQVDGG